jgi:hypothetical protein
MRFAERLILFFVLSCGLVVAQNPLGGLQGSVTDPHGAGLAAATISVKSDATGISRSFRSFSDGSFRIEGLEPGTYLISASAPNLSGREQRVAVRVSEVATIKLDLTVAATNEAVEVRETVPDATSSVISNPVTQFEIENTPLANRSFANIAYIAPMTAPVEPSDPTKARITAVSFAGSSGLNVDLSVDGGDNNDDYIGGFLQNYSPEAIREFNVRTAQFDPDTSRTNGGSIIISTRSGTNDWHGSVAGFFRADALNARNELDNPAPNPKQPYSKQDYVGTLGGPIKKDKLWLFAAYEYNRENASVAYSNFSLSQFQNLASLAASGQIPGVPSIPTPSSVSVPFRDSLFDSRIDWQQSGASRWFIRSAVDRNKTQNDLVQQGAMQATGFTTNSHYYNVLLSDAFLWSDRWVATTTIEASLFDHNKLRNSNLGFALAFPFSTTALTTSGFETFGDNQFVTAITAFPIERDQQKYQFRYDLSRSGSRHNLKLGINFIHEPVLSGRFPGTPERLIQFADDPGSYVLNGISIAPFFTCDPTLPQGGAPPACPNGATVTDTSATNGMFSQSIRRIGFYGQDNWRVTPHLVFNYGIRYDTTFGLFVASGRDQNQNATVQALRAAGVPFASGIPHDYRGGASPRLGFAYAPGRTVFRAGIGLYYNDLAQNGWAEAFQAVNGGFNLPSVMIDPHYHSPYAIQASAGIEHELSSHWRLAAQFEHQQGVHQYRRYEYVSGISLPTSVPSASVFRTDNRSRYDGGSLILKHQGGRYDVTAHYTFAKATTWGATVGELFDYVNGVSDPLNPFGPGDHGPSGEDIRHRFVIEGVFELPAHFQVSTLAQFESARPYTMSTPVDINGDGNVNDRAVVNGVQTSLDQFRGQPFSQIDLRISRNFQLGERVSVRPFAELFNVLNRQNPGNNFIPDISALPTSVNDISNATALCLDTTCSTTRPIRSIKDLRVPAGALGDFFGPGTTVGIPFAAQLGFKISF